MSRAGPPLVVLGLDAGDPGFIAAWAAEGRLPTIARIMGRGAWGRTVGPELVSEHGAWISLFSGTSRSDHGCYYFRQLVPGTYDLTAVTGGDLDVEPFWAGLRDRRVAAIDVPDLSLVPGLPGAQIADWGSHVSWNPDRFPPRSEPPGLLADVQRRFERSSRIEERHDSDRDEDRRLRRDLLESVLRKGAMCRHVLADGEWDLVVVVFGETHAALHQFWRYGPGVPEADRVDDDELCDALRDVYAAVDRELGRLIDLLPADANVAILGSVGGKDAFPAGELFESACRAFGYQPAPSAKGMPGPVEALRRLVPEAWRETVGRWLLPRDRREALLARRFRASTDWSRTTAFAIPSAYTGFLRVNLAGREPLGTVDPADYGAVLGRLEEDLGRLVDPTTGEAVVERIGRTVDLFGGGPPEVLPDLFVRMRPGRFLERVVHPGGAIVQRRPDFFRRSDHSDEGFFALAGPSVGRRGEIDGIAVLDVAPTLMALLGAAPPGRLTGTARGDLLRAG